MHLLKAVRYERLLRESPEPSVFIAWLEFVQDPACSAAVLAANIHVIRRLFPFAYVLLQGNPLDAWHKGDLGFDEGYLATLDRVVVVSADGEKTLIISLHYSDVLPFTRLIEYEGCSLLCLRRPQSLERVGQAITSSSAEAQRVTQFDAGEAASITIVDGVCFAVTTQQQAVGWLFANEEAQSQGG